MGDNKLEKAYFRHLRSTKQCELLFSLQVKHEKFGHIDETIKSLRRDCDTITSLLQHTANKIVHVIKTKIGADNDVQVNVSLTRNQVGINGNIECVELVNYRNKIRLVVFDKSYHVVVNAPILNEISLPAVIYSGSPVTPCIKGFYVAKNVSKFTWSKSRDKITWIEVGSEFEYLTTIDDVGYHLKVHCVPKNSYNEGPPGEGISENVVQIIHIEEERFPFESRHVHTANKTEGKNIRIMSYNVLAERYTLDEQFSYCDPKYLSIEYRKRLLLKEITGYNADVICLQELDASTFNHFFKNEFAKQGYKCVFNRKGNKIPEGLACIYNNSRLQRLAQAHVVLTNELRRHDFRDVKRIVERNKDVKELFLKQQTSLQVTALKLDKTKEVLLIANTHLYYHYEANHIRLLQITIALRFIANWCRKLKLSDGEKASVIFCGDFNSRPDSGVYHFITERNLDKCVEELKKIGIQSVTKAITNNFNFKSACGTPQFTNYTSDFKGCLDYIFVEKNKTVVKNVVPFPNEPQLSEYVALPNKNFPSDHIALVADLRL